MRLWSIHPSQLDRAALIAGWREGLLAQKVLAGLTKGYRNHPQLQRFRACNDPTVAIGAWLQGLQEEATRRGYKFDATKITHRPANMTDVVIDLTTGQLEYEAQWLRTKIEKRAPELLVSEPWVSGAFEPHPLFRLIPGDIAPWEKVN